MLYTNLNHIETLSQHDKIINENQNALIVGGRMDYNSIKVYQVAEDLKKSFKQVNFYDMELDNPELISLNTENESPVIMIYKKGKIVNTLKGFQSKNELNKILKEQFI